MTLRICVILAATLIASLTCGCQDPARSVSGLQERAITGGDTDAVLAEAAVVLRREFGRVRVNPSNHSIETAYVEFSAAHDTGAARELVGAKSLMRRRAFFMLGQRGETIVARLRVEVERRDSEQQSITHPRGARLSDSPGQESAIDRDAATTTEQNSVWTLVRRDTPLERQLLQELQEKFTRLAAERDAESAPPPAPPAAPAAPAAPTQPAQGTRP